MPASEGSGEASRAPLWEPSRNAPDCPAVESEIWTPAQATEHAPGAHPPLRPLHPGSSRAPGSRRLHLRGSDVCTSSRGTRHRAPSRVVQGSVAAVRDSAALPPMRLRQGAAHAPLGSGQAVRAREAWPGRGHVSGTPPLTDHRFPPSRARPPAKQTRTRIGGSRALLLRLSGFIAACRSAAR